MTINAVLTRPAGQRPYIPDWLVDAEYRMGSRKTHPSDKLWLDRCSIMSRAGIAADSWQREVLLSTADRILICCTRQAGKSTTVAALAVLTALLESPALILIVSRTMRQSGELFRKVKRFYRSLVRPGKARPFQPRPVRDLDRHNAIGDEGQLVAESALQLELANGSRIVSLPGNADNIVCFSGVRLLIIDEAARVPDTVFGAVSPMLSVSHGRMVCASTPFGRRGFFFHEWEGKGEDGRPLPRNWHQVRITADQCPRIDSEFLESERASLGQRWYAQEYLTSFEAAIDSVFDPDEVQASLKSGTPLTLGGFAS